MDATERYTIETRPMRTLLLTLFFACSLGNLFAYQLRGTISDENAHPIPGATIYLKNSTYGVATDIKGAYFMELENGTHTLVYRAVGYETQEISIKIQESDLVKHVILKESITELNTVVVTADGEDPAYPIMRKAIDNKKKYFRQFETSQCMAYVKASLQKEEETQSIDTSSFEIVTDVNTSNMEFIESKSMVYFKADRTYREVKFAYKDHTKQQRLDFGSNAQVSFTYSPLQEDYAPPQTGGKVLFYDEVTDADINFYQNLLSIPLINDKPFVSPLAASSMLTYNFKLITSFREDDLLVHKIEVTPKRPYGPYFSGTIYIVDELWCIKAVEFDIDKASLGPFISFRMIINYERVADGKWVPTREEFFYNSREGAELIGHSVAMYSDYVINPELDKSIFKAGLSTVTDDAEDKGLEYWQSSRPITLKPEEVKFLKGQDSIRAYYSSEAYMAEADSSYNETKIWDFLFTGVGYRNSFKGYQFSFAPLIAQPRPFAVGGYRHALSGNYSKTFKESRKSIGFRGQTSFGFLNNDIRGQGSLVYGYDPKRFGEVEIGGGSIYEMVNTYESIAATFSRSNYVLTEHISAGYKREIVNGLFVGANLRYSDQKSLEDYELADWSGALFGERNTPQPFERYTKLVLDTRVTIRFKQQYHTRPNRKIIVGSKYPQLRIRYKLGIPDVLGSDVSFQYFEVRVFDDFEIGSFGESKYNVYAGSFINPIGTRFVDYKFFRGSDRYFYSNPLYSFQLLGPSINTKEPFLQGHYIHHFNGTLLDKVPLINRLRLRTVVGASTLMELSNDFAHAEAYLGLERVFRIGLQQFKLGVYYVGAQSTHTDADATFKIGIDFYNSFTNSWSY